MLDFFKEKKKVIFCILGVVLMIGYYFYTTNTGYTETEEEFWIAANDIKEEKEKETKDEEEIVVVHIAGAVKNPGIVKLKEGSRIEDAIEAAGGLTEDANISDVNLAYILDDGTKINIPSINDEYSQEEIVSDDGGTAIAEEFSNDGSNSLININTATETELETLPGIGPTIANKIVEYRKENGNFNTIEDIKNVSGIGESKYASIEELITIK